MLSRTRLLLAASIASCGLAAGTCTALAEKLAISPAGSITATSLGNLSFRSPLVTVSCAVTLSGTLASTAATYGEVGSVTSVRGTETCRGATVRADATPWDIVVGAPLGTLPNALTGIGVDVDNAGFLFNINAFGREVRCDYFGKIATLTPLSGTNPYRTGLLTLQTREARLELDASLDTSGLCPRASEVSISGTLSATTQTLTASAFVLDPTPESPITFTNTEVREIVFRNISGVVQRIRRVALTGSTQYTLDSQNCLIGAVTEMAANTTCTVRVRFTNPGGRTTYYGYLRIYGDPSETWLGGVSMRG